MNILELKLKILKENGGKIYDLTECSPYKYMVTKDVAIYNKYINLAIEHGGAPENGVWSHKDFDNLLESIKKHGYDPTKSVICINEKNCVLDGQHRSCALLSVKGGEYEITVVRVSRK